MHIPTCSRLRPSSRSSYGTEVIALEAAVQCSSIFLTKCLSIYAIVHFIFS